AEVSLLGQFASVPFPFLEHAPGWCADTWANDILMTGKWDWPQFLQYLNDWPVIQGIERRGGFDRLDVWHLRKALAWAWGQKKAKRLVRLPVTLRVGFAA